MSTAETIVQHIQELETICEEIAANASLLNVHHDAKVEALRSKAAEYLAHFRRNVPDWPQPTEPAHG